MLLRSIKMQVKTKNGMEGEWKTDLTYEEEKY